MIIRLLKILAAPALANFLSLKLGKLFLSHGSFLPSSELTVQENKLKWMDFLALPSMLL